VSAQSSAYLAFTVAGLDCAVAAERVDRIVGPQSLIRLPRPSATDANGAVRLEGAIELRGQVLPVAALRVRLGLARTAAEQPPCEPQAYVILRGAQGLGAIGVDQARRLVELRPEEIVPAPADDRTVVAGVAALGEGRLLRIIAADRLWSGA
jgi:chemotaxis signal transduction protein